MSKAGLNCPGTIDPCERRRGHRGALELRRLGDDDPSSSSTSTLLVSAGPSCSGIGLVDRTLLGAEPGVERGSRQAGWPTGAAGSSTSDTTDRLT